MVLYSPMALPYTPLFEREVGDCVQRIARLRRIGVDRKQPTQIELGRMELIDTETLQALCGFYGVQVGDLLEYVPGTQKN